MRTVPWNLTAMERMAARENGRCDAFALRGTGVGTCDRPLDEHGQCDRASQHLGGKDYR